MSSKVGFGQSFITASGKQTKTEGGGKNNGNCCDGPCHLLCLFLSFVLFLIFDLFVEGAVLWKLLSASILMSFCRRELDR